MSLASVSLAGNLSTFLIYLQYLEHAYMPRPQQFADTDRVLLSLYNTAYVGTHQTVTVGRRVRTNIGQQTSVFHPGRDHCKSISKHGKS
jgi:hypothetical protein